MDIFDSPYFRINKMMLSALGLWPYDSRRHIIKIFWSVLLLSINIPHVIAAIVDVANVDKLMEQIGFLLISLSAFLKHLTLTIAENKMKSVYEDIANNWSIITNQEEKTILAEYSKKARIITIGYVVLLYFAAGSFVMLPLLPIILNVVKPLPEARAYFYIFQGEFLVDNPDDHFWKIYAVDAVTAFSLMTIFVSVDPMYAASVDHCTALYAVVTHRLTQLRQKGDEKEEEEGSYECLAHTIKLHQVALSFVNKINDSYSLCFFGLTLMNILCIPLCCVLIIINLQNPVNFFRFSAVLSSLMMHLFVLFWPGQKLIDHSAKLLEDAYCNHWYETSAKTKRILRIFMLRCSQPSLITAGGLVVMNFETYLGVVKTAASYITVLASFR